mmetsp:Transcript_86134/g.162317  ORF Transcript_86134/g.162317 Transcript_86134/m.162317 type:complete len:110 (-) Transcript_86134:13-342(-)
MPATRPSHLDPGTRFLIAFLGSLASSGSLSASASTSTLEALFEAAVAPKPGADLDAFMAGIPAEAPERSQKAPQCTGLLSPTNKHMHTRALLRLVPRLAKAGPAVSVAA